MDEEDARTRAYRERVERVGQELEKRLPGLYIQRSAIFNGFLIDLDDADLWLRESGAPDG